MFVLLWLGMIISRSNHDAANALLHSSLWLSNILLYTYCTLSLSIYISMAVSWLLCPGFRILATVDSAAVNTGLQQSFQSSSVEFSPSVMSDSLRPYGLQHARFPCLSPTPGAFSNSCPSFPHMPRSGMAGSYGNSVFSFLKSICTVLHSGCPTQQCGRVLFSLQPLIHSFNRCLLFMCM